MRTDGRPAEVRAFEAAAKLKMSGSWEAVEAAAILAVSCPTNPESRPLLDAAESAAKRLKAGGSWDSVRALAWLSRARQELG